MESSSLQDRSTELVPDIRRTFCKRLKAMVVRKFAGRGSRKVALAVDKVPQTEVFDVFAFGSFPTFNPLL